VSRHGLRGLVARAHADVLDASKCGSDARVSGIYEPYYHLSEAIADANLSSHHLAAVMASRGTAYESKGEKGSARCAGIGRALRVPASRGSRSRLRNATIADLAVAPRDAKRGHLAPS